MKYKFASLVMLFAFLVVLIPAQSAVTAQETDPVTLRLSEEGNFGNFDPVTVITSNNIEITINLFATLFYTHPEDYGRVEPFLVKSWEVSDDGLTYTFTLRDDIPWVWYNPDTGEIKKIRIVNADDVVYATRRMCNTLQNGYYATDVFGPVIDGCQLALDGRDTEVVGVTALDAFTVQFQLTAPGDYFLTMATLWTIAPVPREAVEEHGNSWLEPGKIITNGPFVLESFSTSQVTYLKNPYFPEDLRGSGNVERVVVSSVPSLTAFSLFEDDKLERTPTVTDNFLDNHPEQVVSFPDSTVMYYGISTDKAPMDDVHIRRAFAAALSRQDFINLGFEGAKPMYHFAPQTLFGGLAGTAAGIGYDPEFARRELAESDYPGCQGMPALKALVWSEAWATFLEESLADIGCDIELDYTVVGYETIRITIEAAERVPVDQRPHFWTAGWGPDYADADNFMSLLACGVNNNFRKSCTEVDDKIRKARQSTDSGERLTLYHELQEDLFGRQGEFPIIPIFEQYEIRAVQPWFKGPHETNGVVGGERYDYYTIDTGESPPVAAQDSDTTPETPDSEETPQSETTPPPEGTPLPETTPDVQTSGNCTVTTLFRVNLRRGAGLEYEVIRVLPLFHSYSAPGKTEASDGYTWWQLDHHQGWVRGDVVQPSAECLK